MTAPLIGTVFQTRQLTPSASSNILLAMLSSLSKVGSTPYASGAN
jgi:hypothetical protein